MTKVNWTAENDKLITQHTAEESAKILGCSMNAIYNRRCKLKVRGKYSPKSRVYFLSDASKIDDATRKSITAKVGTDSDAAIAAEHGVNGSAVRRIRNATGVSPRHNTGVKKSVFSDPEIEAMLGEYPDYVLAGMLGISQPAVNYARRRRGIPACQAKRRKNPLSSYEISLLGTDTDHSIAKIIGRTATTVQVERTARGIPPYDQRRKAKR